MLDQDISALVDFGLTVLQARVYIELLARGESPAGRLSLAIGIIRPEAYRLLRELSVKGLVQKNLGSPATYTAVPPREALTLLAEKHRAKLVELSRKKNALLQSLTRLSDETIVSKQGVSLIKGGGNLIIRTREMITRGRHDYVAIRSRFGLARMRDNGIADAMIAARKRKMTVRLISEIDSRNIEVANYVSRYVEMRRSKGLLFYMDIVDGREMVFGPAFPLSDEEAKRLDTRELDLWTTNLNFVRGMYAMFERLWGACPRYRNVRTHRAYD